MKFYCGIDLSARDCQVSAIDEHLQIMVQQGYATICPRIIKLLMPYQAGLQILVESESRAAVDLD